MKHPLYCPKCSKDEPFDYDEYHDKLDWQDIAILVTVAIAVAIIVVEYIV